MSDFRKLLMNVGRGIDDDIYLLAQKHVCFHGQTGSGKSSLLFLMLQRLTRTGIPFALLDGGGDLAKDLSAWAWRNWSELRPLVRRAIFWIELSTKCGVSLDHFDAGGRTGSEYIAWLSTRVATVARLLIRGGQEFTFADMKRLQRILSDVLYAVGTDHEPGKHIGLDKALDVLDFSHDRWAEGMLKLWPVLPAEVSRDFNRLSLMSISAREEEIGSTVNRLRAFLSPHICALYESDKPRLDFPKVIRERGIILADLAPSSECSLEQSITFGGLLLTEIMDALETAQNRSPFVIVIDEVTPYLGSDLIGYLSRSRKWGASIWVGIQNVGAFL